MPQLQKRCSPTATKILLTPPKDDGDKIFIIMGFAEAIKTCFSKYATFSGRATRSEFWYWQLFTFLVSMVLTVVFFPLAYVASLVFFIPNLAVYARRLHDTGRSGYNLFWAFLPLIGAILLLIWALQESKDDNQYGPNPFKEEVAEA